MVTLEKRLEGDEGFSHADAGGESNLPGNSKCKGPKVRASLKGPRNQWREKGEW